MTYAELIQGIQSSIKNEYEDYRYYVELAKRTSDINEKEIIMGIAKDERRHAYSLKEAYFKLTGRMPEEDMASALVVPEYKESLKLRILAEASHGEKYKDFYINARMDWLKEKFLKIMKDESEHAVKVSSLINDEDKEASIPAKKFSGGCKKNI